MPAASEKTPPEPKATRSWVSFRVWMPPEWHRELKAAAKANGVAMADIVRMALRSFLSARYGKDGQP